MENVEQVDTKLKRDVLNELALEAGLTGAERYETKTEVVAAINRVRAGEDAETVNAEFQPAETDGDYLEGDYLVRVTNEFTTISGASSRTRAGVVVPASNGYTGRLTDAQLKEIQDDNYLTVEKV